MASFASVRHHRGPNIYSELDTFQSLEHLFISIFLILLSKKLLKISFFYKIKNYLNFFFLHISSSYSKILGETNFHTREIPRSGSKAENGEKKRKRKKKSELWHGAHIAHALRTHCARKPPGPINKWELQGVKNINK